MAITPKQTSSSDSDDSVRPETFELACIAARAADDKQATNTIVLSVGNVLRRDWCFKPTISTCCGN
jgi:hypothetical protein